MSSFGFRPTGEIFTDAMNLAARPPAGIKIPGFPIFNHLTGGLLPGDLTLLSAPTGAGKTLWLAQVATKLWEAGLPMFVAPVETGDVDFALRMVSVLEGKDWNRGDPIPEALVEAARVSYGKKFAERPMWIASYDNRVPLEEMESQINYQIQENGIRLALLDNLQFFLPVTRSEDQNLEMDEAVRVLGGIAKKKKIHIILICHPKKTDHGRIVSEFDIKGSSTLVQEAANVILWNRPTDEESSELTDRILVYKKCRRRGAIVGIRMGFVYKNGSLFEDENLFRRLNPKTGDAICKAARQY